VSGPVRGGGGGGGGGRPPPPPPAPAPAHPVDRSKREAPLPRALQRADERRRRLIRVGDHVAQGAAGGHVGGGRNVGVDANQAHERPVHAAGEAGDDGAAGAGAAEAATVASASAVDAPLIGMRRSQRLPSCPLPIQKTLPPQQSHASFCSLLSPSSAFTSSVVEKNMTHRMRRSTYQHVHQPVPVQASLKKRSITACSAGQHDAAYL